MSTVLGTYAAPPAPIGLRAVRALLLATAGLAVLAVGGYLSLAPITTDRAGEATWGLVPAVAALLLARRMGPGRRWVLRGVVALAVSMILLALGRLGAGELQGLTNLLLPVTLLALVSRREVREYLRVDGPPAPARRRAPRRLGLFRRGPAGEGGQTSVEAIGVLAVAAVVIGIATAALVAAPVEEGTSAVICSINDSEDCGGPTGGSASGSGSGGGSSSGAGSEPWCSGIGGCVLRVLGQVGSFAWQVVDAAIDDIMGVFELVMNPSLIIDALRYLLENPGDALWALVWDAESQALWEAGDYGGAFGRVAWNVGSFFIPFVGAARVASALGDLGRLGRVAASADELADLASAGQRAQDVARLGDLDEAADIAADARRQADALRDRADAAGCLSAGSVTLQVLAAGPVGGASTVVVAGGGLCDAAGDAASRADEAAAAAEEARAAAARTPQGAEIVRIGQAGEAAVRGSFDIGPKETVVVNGRTRILDGLTPGTVTEVKNVRQQSLTAQIQDNIDYAKQTGRTFDLYVREDTVLTGPLQDAVAAGDVNLKFIPATP